MTIQDLFMAMPLHVNKPAIQDIEKIIQFHVSGKNAGDYYLDIRNGEVIVHEGQADSPDATINTPEDVWLDIVTGKENGVVAFMKGKFKATGDITLLMSMQNWFNMPT